MAHHTASIKTPATANTWLIGGRSYDLSRTGMIMGIVNVTPDSFSDGGNHSTPEAAVQHALHLAESGANILDIGGESSRPGAEPVNEDEEFQRVIPVIEKLARQTDTAISIDTQKPTIAKEALKAGAIIINDIAANREDETMPVDWDTVGEQPRQCA